MTFPTQTSHLNWTFPLFNVVLPLPHNQGHLITYFWTSSERDYLPELLSTNYSGGLSQPLSYSFGCILSLGPITHSLAL